MVRRSASLVLAIATFLTAAATAATPQTLRIDLAAVDPGSERILTTPPGDYTVQVVSKIPKKAYSIQVEVSFIPIAPLAPPTGGAGLVPPGDPCLELSQRSGRLRNADNEKEVAQLVSEIDSLLQAGSCNDANHKNEATRAVQSTSETLPDEYSLQAGQELKVSITRDGGADLKRWTVIYRTPVRGRWFSSYGFVFAPNEDEGYFSKPKEGTTDRYLITRKRDNTENDFAPSLFYSWLPASRENRALSFGAAAGLGFDQSNPIVFAGPILTYNQNISLLAGLVMHKQKRLNGIYSSNQEVKENLTEAQLQEESYRPNVFFGLSFRFGSNPFASSEAKTAPATAKPQPQKP